MLNFFMFSVAWLLLGYIGDQIIKSKVPQEATEIDNWLILTGPGNFLGAIMCWLLYATGLVK